MDGRFCFHDLADAVGGYGDSGCHGEEHGESHEAHDDLHGVVHEDDHTGEKCDFFAGSGPVNEDGADPVDGDAESVHDKAHAGALDHHDAVGGEVGVGELFVGVFEFAFLVAFGVVGFDDSDAQEVFAGDPVDVVGQALQAFESRHSEFEDDRDED